MDRPAVPRDQDDNGYHTVAWAMKQPPSQAMVITSANPPFHIEHVNSAWCKVTGFTSSFAKAKSLKILQGPATSRQQIHELMTAVKGRETFRISLKNYTSTRQPIRNHLQIVPLVTELNGPVTHYLAIMEFEYEAVVKTRDATKKLQQALVFLEASRSKKSEGEGKQDARASLPRADAKRRFSLFARRRSQSLLEDVEKLKVSSRTAASAFQPAQNFMPDFSPGEGGGKADLFSELVKVKSGGELQMLRDHDYAFGRGGRFKQGRGFNGNALFDTGFYWSKPARPKQTAEEDAEGAAPVRARERRGSTLAFIAVKAPRQVRSVQEAEEESDEEEDPEEKIRGMLVRSNTALSLAMSSLPRNSTAGLHASSAADNGPMHLSMLESTTVDPRRQSMIQNFHEGRGGSVKFLQYPRDRSLVAQA